MNLVAIDNSYYRFEQEQFEMLKIETSFGLPVILFIHNPLYEPEFYKVAIGRADNAYLTSAPEAHMKSYSEYRCKQQRADEITLETTVFIETEPLFRAVFAGHLHYDYNGVHPGGLHQYVTGIGTGRLIEIK